MKKITLLLFVTFTSFLVYAGGDWASSSVSLTLNDGTAYKFKLNDEGWTDGNWQTNSSFWGYDFAFPDSLILNGGSGNAWVSDGDYYNSTSFVLYYRVYRLGDTPGAWSSINLTNQSYHSGSNYIYDKLDANIDVLALANIPGLYVYRLEVVMSKNQFYSGGNWNSMVPGGQAVAYNPNTAGFFATFFKNVISTDNSKLESTLKLSGANGKVCATFDGSAKVDLYSSSGQLMRSVNTENVFSEKVKAGLYLLRINGKTHKIVVN